MESVKLRAVRRFLVWHLPLAIAVVAAAVFAGGFYSFLSGNTGEAVAPVTRAIERPAKLSSTITPLVIGDSLARGAGDETGLGIGGRLIDELKKRGIPAAKAPVNIAINGAVTSELARQVQSRNVQTLMAQSNVIIISIGGNDLWSTTAGLRGAGRKDPEKLMTETLSRIASIVSVVRAANPRARIFLIGLYNPFANAPFGAFLTTAVNRWNAMEITRFANDPNLTVVQTSDIFSHRARLSLDNFHPNDEGYELIARRVADSL
jgi:lysophospholipase L1-like esterase